jgi:hypothetical protein
MHRSTLDVHNQVGMGIPCHSREGVVATDSWINRLPMTFIGTVTLVLLATVDGIMSNVLENS